MALSDISWRRLDYAEGSQCRQEDGAHCRLQFLSLGERSRFRYHHPPVFCLLFTGSLLSSSDAMHLLLAAPFRRRKADSGTLPQAAAHTMRTSKETDGRPPVSS